MYFNPFIFMMTANSSEVNCCQLSETIYSGMPFLAGMYAEIFVRGGRGEFISHYYGLAQHFI